MGWIPPNMGAFVVPNRVEICGTCGGRGEVMLGQREQPCGRCGSTGMLVDWMRVEEREMEELENGGNSE